MARVRDYPPPISPARTSAPPCRGTHRPAPVVSTPVSGPRPAPVQQLEYAPVSYQYAPVYYWPGN